MEGTLTSFIIKNTVSTVQHYMHIRWTNMRSQTVPAVVSVWTNRCSKIGSKFLLWKAFWHYLVKLKIKIVVAIPL